MTTFLQQTQNRDRLGSCLSALLGRVSRRSLETPSSVSCLLWVFRAFLHCGFSSSHQGSYQVELLRPEFHPCCSDVARPGVGVVESPRPLAGEMGLPLRSLRS